MDSCTPSSSTNSKIPSGACHLCSKIFKTVKIQNHHIKIIHKIDVSIKKINHIICPLCDQGTNLLTHEILRKHLEEHHQISIELVTLEFSSKQEYETWKDMQKIETSYIISRVRKATEHKILYYECNRSDTSGYKPNNKIRAEKSGGSIKIKGVCPSRLICKLRDQGEVSVRYWKTHAGHKEELRAMRLSKAQEKMVVEKLMSGAPPSRILEDLRKLETQQLGRLAVLKRKDLANLRRKYNIHKKRDQNDMVATAFKVQEWNASSKNYTFVFKKEDDAATCLGEISIIQPSHEEEINEFVRGKLEQTDLIEGKTKRSLQLENLTNKTIDLIDEMEDLDDESFTKLYDQFMTAIQIIKCKAEENLQKNAENITTKRKIENLEYFPSKKRKH
ncbi:uncharacterized protein LOC114334248 [Diabrotica virgifera virgifera]|uniref:C2H2-type domain-containing protein n=1 Tax=Diabrotica virgifera virgifera TaxID=50390 RepID=A0ABM5IRX1_DIAVI|nr:uncharacterized protein LOC114334248 [Diabrotica virgifera virgifera]